MKKQRLPLALFALLALCGAGVARADEHDDDRDDRGNNIPVRSANGAPLDFRLIQAGAFNPSSTPGGVGTDQLAQNTNNHVAVLNNRTAQIEFHPVVTLPPSPLTYRIWFCRFGAIFGPANTGSGCVALLDPASTATPKAPLALTVDASGAAKGSALFPALAANTPAGSDVWSGSFVITRDVTTAAGLVSTAEFVSAFEFPSAPEQGQAPQQPVGAEIELKGEISGIDVAAKSFQLAGASAFKVVVDDSTRFIGRYKSLEDLNNGMEVVVSGTLQTDSATNTSFVLAERIRAARED